jgi:hypothetical protein
LTTFTAWVTEMFTFHKNGYTVAMAFATKIVEIQWLPLTKIGFLMSSSSPPFIDVVIVVNAVASSTPMAEMVGGPVLLVGENGVSTPPPSDTPGLSIGLGHPVVGTLGLGRLGLFGFCGGASRLALARGGCHFYIFIFNFLCAEAGGGTISKIIDISCPAL